MERLTLYLTLTYGLLPTNSEYALFDCPAGWEGYGEHCYRFIQDTVVVSQAKTMCRELGDKTFVVSINSDLEHKFLVDILNTKYDTGTIKRDWWTSGRRESEREEMSFYWEGDGHLIESYFYWHNTSIPKDTSKGVLLYNFNGYKWGWILGTGMEKRPFVCKISKEDIYQITEEIRGPDYGIDNWDPRTVPRGPTFVQQPETIIYEKMVTSALTNDFVALDCVAEGSPQPTFQWFKERAGMRERVDPTNDQRYTYVNGRLVIHGPSSQQGDDGVYQCMATNQYGSVLSNTARLEFGFISDFPKDRRSPVSVIAYQWGSIECSPPDHYPEVTYAWYKNDQSNWVRPQLKHYIFISHDGGLYFSETTTDDKGEYYCMVSKPGTTRSSGANSMPTRLNVIEGSPGIYEPEIQSGFPRVYPRNPKVGQTIRLECFASGTSQPPLMYFWEKIEKFSDGGERKLPLPESSRMMDHNRVLLIRNVGMYDGGTYRCICSRPLGIPTSKDVQLILQAVPSFVVSLTPAFVDEGSTLRWHCEAAGEPAPTYSWLKNGHVFDNSAIKDHHNIKISQNSLTITNANATRDNGMYQCVASNIHGTRYSAGELRVLSFAPTFAKLPLPRNQFGTMGGNATIFCRPEAAPTPTIIWYKNGAIMSPGNDDAARVRQMTNGNLFISPLLQSDQAVYKCTAENKFGIAESTGNLTVLDQISISYPPHSPTNIQVNKTSFLHCVASYHPHLDVTYVWYHGSALVEFEKVYRFGENHFEVWTNPHYKRGSGHYLGGMYLMNVNYGLTGRYTCVVESTNGDKFSRWADVRIVGPPSEPAGVFIDSTSSTPTSVMIQWIAGGSNGKRITSFIIETYNHWEGFWRIHQTNVWEVPDDPLRGIIRHNITGLRPHSQYQIRVRAENDYGTSVPSIPSDVFWTSSVLPDRYPEEIGGGGGKVGDLVVTWQPMNPWEHNGRGFGYRIYTKKAGDSQWGEKNEIVTDPNSARKVILVGQRNFFKAYDVAIQAFNEVGDGPISPSVTIRSAMKLPNVISKNVRAVPLNATACLVTWTKVEENIEKVGGHLGGYRVAYWLEQYGSVREDAPRVTFNGQVEEGLVIGLKPNTKYNFGVYVWNDAGNGPISSFFTQQTLRQAPINQPVEVRVYRLAGSSIQVTWRGVSTTSQEEPLIGYKVRVWADGTHIKAATDFNAQKEDSLQIYNLNPLIRYKLRVYGYSRGGEGTMSSPAVEFSLGGAPHMKATFIFSCLTALTLVIINFP